MEAAGKRVDRRSTDGIFEVMTGAWRLTSARFQEPSEAEYLFSYNFHSKSAIPAE
jgi:ribosome-associated toxin RatA of RatAB toxin-antitoxin module